MTTIYIVYSCMECGGEIALRAFTDQAKAEAYKLECEAYHNSEPQFPIERCDDHAKAAEYDKAFAAWVAGHPGGEICIFDDSFKVQALDLVP